MASGFASTVIASFLFFVLMAEHYRRSIPIASVSKNNITQRPHEVTKPPKEASKRPREVDKRPKTTTTKKPKQEGELIFFEDFDKLDLNLWQPIITMSGCGSGEFQIYDKHEENLYVKDGILHIQPTLTADRYGEEFLYNGTLVLENCTDPLYNGCNKTASDGFILNPVISARIRTLQSFSFKYGKVEARARIPSGDWIWPAIWMNPRDQLYGVWPMSGEIDILESRGNDFLYDTNWVNVGTRQVQSTVHFGNSRTDDKWRLAHVTKNSDIGFDEEFHRYQFEWTPESMTFGVDDVVTMIIKPPKGGFYEFGNFTGENIWANGTKMAPFDQPFYFILNAAVGGTTGYFSDGNLNFPTPKPWRNGEPMENAMLEFWNQRRWWLPTWTQPDSSFKIDYIKVWSL